MATKKTKTRTVPATTNNLTNAIINYVISEGGFAFRVNTAGIFSRTGWRRSNSRGVSDILAVIKGCFVAIEVKNKLTSDRMRTTQVTFKRKVEEAGGEYIIADDYEQFKKDVEDYFILP